MPHQYIGAKLRQTTYKWFLLLFSSVVLIIESIVAFVRTFHVIGNISTRAADVNVKTARQPRLLSVLVTY